MTTTESAQLRQKPLFPEVPVRQPRSLRVLAWMELLSGGVGLLTSFLVSVTYPTSFPTWQHLHCSDAAQ